MLSQGKVITVWSPRGRCGKSITAINIAKRLSDIKGNTILVDMDLRQPRISDYLFLQDSLHNLDNLYSYVVGQSLTKEIIASNMEDKLGLSVLKGTTNIQEAESIDYKIFMPIISLLKNLYSYIVIDCSSQIDNAGTYVALKEADVILSLFTKDIITAMTFSEIKPLLFGNFNDEKFRFVINQDNDKIYMQKSEIEKFLNISFSGSLPDLGIEIVNDVNKGQIINLIDKKQNSHYLHSLDQIIKECVLDGDQDLDKKKTKNNIFRIFKK